MQRLLVCLTELGLISQLATQAEPAKVTCEDCNAPLLSIMKMDAPVAGPPASLLAHRKSVWTKVQ